MRLGVKQQLIAAMLAASIIATLAMGIASQVAFNRGFLDYLNEQALTRLIDLVPRVAQLYEQHDGWGYLRAHPQAWFEIIGIPGGPNAIPLGNAAFTPGNVDLTGAGLRISLLDERHQFLIGLPTIPMNAPSRPVEVRGHTVGWLVVVPLQQAGNLAQARFQSRQLMLTWLIGAVAIAVAALSAVPLSHVFLTPIQRVTAATRRLAAGDYSARVHYSAANELGQLATDVNQLAHALDATEKMRRNLMADVSHELRTPLAVLRAELEALDDGVRSLSRESLKSLLAEVAILSKLVDDVHDLAIADVGAVSFRMHTVDLAQILQTCVITFRERFERRQLRVNLEIQSAAQTVRGDERRLQQLFNNLLENSARYTDAGGCVQISCCQTTDNAVSCRIEDSAPGVADDALPQLFERFYRADMSRNRTTGGSGLGMAICRSIVAAHGGTISASHSALGGLRIDLAMPLVS